MPLYDYKCDKCGHIFEAQQKITEEPLKYCPRCKGNIKRLISPAGIIFKGSGFHVTDYGKKEVKETKPAEKSATGGSASGGKTETKKETKEPKS